MVSLNSNVVGRPDYSIQPGDEGPCQGEIHHEHEEEHEHHGHHHEEVEYVPPPPPVPAPPTPAPQAPSNKNCQLVRQTSAHNNPMCFLEPECQQECNQVPEQKCTTVQEKKCQTNNVVSCNIIGKKHALKK